MKTILAAVLMAAATTGLADDFGLVGTWSGRLTIDTPAAPAGISRMEQRRQKAILQETRRGRLTLRMFRDHRYTIHNEGLPSFGPSDTRGIWSRRGDTLSLIPTGTSRNIRFTVGPAGRRLTATARFGPTTAQFAFTR